MSKSINKVQLLGHVGKDPEIRHRQNTGEKIATFTLATSDNWKDKTTGETKTQTEWHRIVVFSARLAEVIEKYVRKGSKLLVEGKITTREWDDKGIKKYVTEVVLSDFRGDIILLDGKPQISAETAETHGSGNTQASYQPTQTNPAYGAPASSYSSSYTNNNIDDDIPF